MTENFIVRIIFVGLIAFVPMRDKDTRTLTSLIVLLPDARGVNFASDGCMVPPHIPALFVEADTCTISGKACEPDKELVKHFGRACDPQPGKMLSSNVIGSRVLNDTELVLDMTPGIQLQSGAREKSSQLPKNTYQAGDFSWVPTSPIASNVNPRCLSGNQGCPIAARVKLPFGTAKTCHLLDTKDAANNVCAFELTPLSLAPKRSANAQAIADSVMISFTLPRQQSVKIKLSGLAHSPSEDIILTPGNRPFVNVWIMNMPLYHDSETDVCTDRTADKHFETYYNLAAPQAANQKPVPLAARPVPHITNICTKAALVEPDPTSSEGCPLLFFTDEQDCSHTNNPYPGDKIACGHYQFAPADIP